MDKPDTCPVSSLFSTITPWGVGDTFSDLRCHLVHIRQARLCQLLDQCVERDQAWSEQQDQQGSEQEVERSGGSELVGVGEEREEGFVVAEPVSREQVNGQRHGDEARGESGEQQHSAGEFEQRDHDRRGVRHRHVDAGEVIGDLAEVVELGPSVMRELAAEEEAHDKKEQRLAPGEHGRQAIVEAIERFHGSDPFSESPVVIRGRGKSYSFAAAKAARSVVAVGTTEVVP